MKYAVKSEKQTKQLFSDEKQNSRQGKSLPAVPVFQKVEEEEPLQGKFETAQRIEEEELIQGKFDAVQRIREKQTIQCKLETAEKVEDESVLQGKFETVQRIEEEELLQGKFETVQRKANNTGLPDQLKSGIENLSGMSMDNVKVHYNSSQPAQLNAHAYAQGSDIHIASGQERHLPHEAWHVVQQAQGRVKPTVQMKGGVPVNDDVSLETEADVMGAKAQESGSLMQMKKGTLSLLPNGRTVQFKEIDETEDYGELGLHNTGNTFSVVDEVSKMDAKLHGGNEYMESVDTKAEALASIAGTAGAIMGNIKSVVAKNGGYTTKDVNMRKPLIETIDPFTHGHIQEYDSTKYICLMYQHSNGLDGYVNSVEEGNVDNLGSYGRSFARTMKYGKKVAKMGPDKDSVIGSYSSQHDTSQPDESLLEIAESEGLHKSDAITKLAGEGARFLWVRNNVKTIKDSTKFEIGENKTHKSSITFRNLWCTWKDWFNGGYNISEDDQKRILLEKVNRGAFKLKGVNRIDNELKG